MLAIKGGVCVGGGVWGYLIMFPCVARHLLKNVLCRACLISTEITDNFSARKEDDKEMTLPQVLYIAVVYVRCCGW